VRVDTEGIGEQAMRMLVAPPADAEGEGRAVVHSATELIVRGSTRPVT
jgi:DNA-binding LacI/PurR family transcriptional regulator